MFNSTILSDNSLEFLNRRVYSFNRGIDKVFLNPCTEFYLNVCPTFLSSKIDNFFSNLYDIQNVFLNLFFFKFGEFNNFLCKVLINSTFGFLGIINLSYNFNFTSITSFFNMSFFPFNIDKKYIILPFIGPGLTNYNFNLLIFQLCNPLFYIFNDLSFFYFFTLILKKSIIYFDINFFHLNFLDGYSFLKNIYFQRFYMCFLK